MKHFLSISNVNQVSAQFKKRIGLTFLFILFAFLLKANTQIKVNAYAKVTGIVGANITLDVSNVDESADSFEDGEKVLLFQMQGATLGSTAQDETFGSVGNIGSAGLYEIATISTHTEDGSSIPDVVTLTASLNNTYDCNNGSVQIISFPTLVTSGSDYTTTDDIEASAWNGDIGGIVAFEVTGKLTLEHNISADGKGFRGAERTTGNADCPSLGQNFFNGTHSYYALKGEGVYRRDINSDYLAGKGRITSGGGGGNNHNGGGGGGANYSEGGNGGKGFQNLCGQVGDYGGLGGTSLSTYINDDRFFMGGGGGAGHQNNGHGTEGGNGGGIVIVYANEIETIGGGEKSISVDGLSASDAGKDGAGAGGAGGTILLNVNTYNINIAAPVNFSAKGGNGGSSVDGDLKLRAGGGGGGQGIALFKNTQPDSNYEILSYAGTGGRDNNNPDTPKSSSGGGGVPEIELIGNSIEISNGDLSPSIADDTSFGQVIAGNTNSHTFTISNNGSSDLTISSIEVVSGDTEMWTESVPVISVVPAGDTFEFDLDFTPTEAGEFDAVVQILSDGDGDETYIFSISGEGISPEASVGNGFVEIASGDASPSFADSTDYGDVVGSGTLDRTFYIRNFGSSGLNLNGATPVSISGTNMGDWAVVSQPTGTVATNDSIGFALRFAPSDIGLREATISIESDDLDEGVYTFGVQGTGVKPVIEVQGNGNVISSGDTDPEASDFTYFGSVVVTESVESYFAIENKGTSTLSLNGDPKVELSGTDASDWYVFEAPDATVSEGGQTGFRLVFLPSSIGTKNATVTIISDDSDIPSYTFSIKGEAQSPEIAVYGNGNAIGDGDTSPLLVDNRDFGNTLVSEETWREFTIKNEGSSLLAMGSPKVSLSGAGAAEFAIETMPGDPISDGDSTVFRISFSPTGTGSKTATVEIKSDDLDEALYDFTIRGTGVSPEVSVRNGSVEVPDGDASPTAEKGTDFGRLNLSAGVLSRTFFVRNSGDAVLTVASVSTATGDPAAFSVSFPSSLPIEVPPGDSVGLEVGYAPTVPGAHQTEVRVASDDLDEGVYDFLVKGRGVSPEITLMGNSREILDGDVSPRAADHTDFGELVLGSGTVVRTFMIVNLGTDTLWLPGDPLVDISGGGSGSFDVTSQPSAGYVAPSGGTRPFEVTFSPVGLGEQDATVTIYSDDVDEGFYRFSVKGGAVGPEIEVEGNGNVIASGDLSPSAGDHSGFGQVAVGGVLTHAFEVKNVGTSALSLTGSPRVSVAGTDAGMWEVSLLPGGTVAEGGSAAFELGFRPTAPGSFSAVVGIESDDLDEGTYIFSISGEGISPEASVGNGLLEIASGDASPSFADSTDYGDVLEGATLDRVFYVYNTGSSPLNLTGASPITISGAGAVDWSVASQPTGTVAKNDSTGFTLRFAPSDIGLREATVSIANDDLDEGVYTFGVQGTGVKPVIEVQGNGNVISSGDITPSGSDFTDFGDVLLSDSTSSYFEIKNLGTSELNLLSMPKVQITGVDAGEFYIYTEPSSTIKAGKFSGFTVMFLPTSIGIKNATISITSNDWSTSPYTFNIQGTSKSPEISVYGNANEITSGDVTPSQEDNTDFGNVLILKDTLQKSYIIKNLGTSQLNLTSQQINISGTDSSAFTIDIFPANSLAVGDSTSAVLSFHPNSLGQKTAKVEIFNDDLDEPIYSFTIQGVGVSPEIGLKGQEVTISDGDNTPDSSDGTDFGEVIFEREYLDRTFVIINTGSSTLELDLQPVEISGTNGADFSLLRSPSTSIAIGDTSSFVLRFSPTSLGDRTATITINSNDLDESVFSFDVKGVGVGPELQLLGNSSIILNGSTETSTLNYTDFESQSIGVDSLVREFTIKNLGTSDLALSGDPVVNIMGDDLSDFKVVAMPSATIIAGDSSSFKIKFAPSDTGVRNATVVIKNDDLDEGDLSFSIKGFGLTPEISIEGNSREIVSGDSSPNEDDYTDFGQSLIVIDSVERLFVIRNEGNTPLNLIGDPLIELTGDVNDFEVKEMPSASINATSSSIIKVLFKPSSLGQKQAIVSIKSDDLDEPIYEFTIQGTGIDSEIDVSGNGVSITDGSTNHLINNQTDFGEIKVSGGKVVHSFTIKNLGNGDLKLTESPIVKIGGENSGDFSVTTQPGTTILSPSDQTVFQVEFNPTRIGLRTAVVAIGNSDLDEGAFSFQIGGVGVLSAPIAQDDYITLNEEDPTYIDVQDNDLNVDGGVLTTSIVYEPVNGAVLVVSGDSLLYTPFEEFNGQDNLTYQICNVNGLCDTATVSITVLNVNSKPVAEEDEGFTMMNQSLEIDVQENDHDPDGETFITHVLTNPPNGKVSVISQENIEYIPNTDFYGYDSFEYTIEDAAGELDTARVTIDVRLVNNPPEAVADTFYVVQNRSVEAFIMTNDKDSDGDPLTLSIISDPVNGNAHISEGDKIIYAPEKGFIGSDRVVYSICDQYGYCDSTNLTVITVYPSDQPVAVDDEATERANTELIIDVQSNDTDTRDLGLITSIISPPVNGSASVNSNQEVVYMPNNNFVGLDKIDYQICDGGGLCDSASISIIVLEWINYPIASNDTVYTSFNSSVVIDALANDSEPDGLELSLSISKDPVNGIVKINEDDRITYTPQDDFVGFDIFRYTICNPDGLCDTASVVVAVSSGPSANADVFSVIKGGTLFIDVANNDTDLDSDLDRNSIKILEQPISGNNVRIEDGGIVVYDSRADFTGQDFLVYEICDLTEKCDSDTIFIFVELPVSEVIVTKKALSPNGDGLNDNWEIEGIEYFPYNHVKIFNRWGDTVFEMEGYNNLDVIWDGTSNRGLSLGGGAVPEGTYFYVIDVGNGEKPITGFIEVKH